MADARLQAAGRKPGRRTWALGAVLVLAALACERAFVPRPEAGADAGHLSAQARRALVMLALAPTPAVAARNQMPAYILRGDGLPDTDPDYPPAPSDNPFIRDLQVKSWAREPFFRTRFYLMDEMLKIQPNPFGERFCMVRWTEDPVKWDVLNAVDLKKAEVVGKVLLDQDLSDDDVGWTSWIYTAAEDRDWVAKNCNITQTIELTKEFQDQLTLIRSRKLGD